MEENDLEELRPKEACQGLTREMMMMMMMRMMMMMMMMMSSVPESQWKLLILR
jgi:hypothetical protein